MGRSGIGSIGRFLARPLDGYANSAIRMGGPRAWKEMQKKQQEFQNTWDREEPANNDDSDTEDGKNVEKRDLVAEYGIEPETENEKSQCARGVGDTGELPGQEDVA